VAQANQCTDASLFGTYGIQEEGQAPGEGFSEFRSVGTIAFDGHGKANRASTIWYSTFQVVQESDQITYSVHSDCTFTFTYSNNGETFTGVIVTGGQKLFYLETSGDPMRTGQAQKITVL